MERIALLGCGGAGKSTLAARLGERLDLPVVHLDAHFWRPGWEPTPRDEWRGIQREILSGDRWIADGNYDSTLDIRFDLADTILFLDQPRWRCLARALARVRRYHDRSRPDLAPGCPEKLDLDFLRWIWRFPQDVRPEVLARLADAPDGVAVRILEGDGGVEAFLAAVG